MQSDAGCDDDVDGVIVEDDSEGSYASDDDCVPAESGLHTLGGLVLPRTVLTQASSKEEDSMLFDLDEDGTSARCTPRVATALMNRQTSLGASLSSSPDDFSFGLPSASMALSTGTPMAVGASGMSITGGVNNGITHAEQANLPMATSVHVTDGGFLWRRMKARSAVKRPNQKSRSGCAQRRMRQSYPPPVVAFAPDNLNGLFSDMDETEWKTFMALWLEGLESALASSAWKQSMPKDASVAQSCPRF